MGFRNLARSNTITRKAISGLILGSLLLAGSAQASNSDAQASFVSHMQLKIQALRSGSSTRTAGMTLRNRHTLVRTYDRTGYAAIWTSPQGWQTNGQRMFDYLAALPRHGLDPSNYHYNTLKSLRDDDSLAGRIHGDLLLSDAFISLVSDLARGAARSNSLGSRAQSLLLRLKPTDDPAREFDGLLPQHPEYWSLSQALHQLLSNDEGAEQAPLQANRMIKPGDHHPMIAELRERLTRSGDYQPTHTSETGTQLGPRLAAAVAQFQARNGLDDDGIVGPSTLAALNRSRADVIDTLSLNLERWRQAPASFGDSHVRVNIAGQSLEYHHANKPSLRMKVIVGRRDRQTPTTSSEINEVVFNPDWTVPQRIAVVDKLPLIKRDPNYLLERGYTLSAGWSSDAAKVDPLSVDWSQINRNNFPFVLRQQPGPNNALGQVKFLFPNDYAVYLHDTPTRNLFDRGERLFSSGCVRLDQPMALAQALLRDHADGAWADYANSDQTRHVRLSNRVPVHLQYWTAWVDRDGSLQLRNDVYQRDREVLNALRDRGAYNSASQLATLYQGEQTTQLASLGD